MGAKSSRNNPRQPYTMNYKDDEKIELDFRKLSKEIKLTSVLNIHMKSQKQNILASTLVNQTIPFLVSIKAGKVNKLTPVDLILVIDKSNSMEGEKLNLIKESLKYLLDELGPNDRVSIVVFNNVPERIIPLIRMTEEGKQRALNCMNKVKAGKSTDIALAVQHALQILANRRTNNLISSILLLSDGLNSGAYEAIESSMGFYNIKGNYSINTFGYGSDHDPELMTKIADLKSGSFYFVEELGVVDECFVDCLGGLMSQIAKNMELKIKPVNEFGKVELIKAYGDPSQISQMDDYYIYRVPELHTGKSRDFVLDIKIPKVAEPLQEGNKIFELARAKAIIQDLTGEDYLFKKELKVEFFNEDEGEKLQDDDKDVLINFYRVKAAGEIAEAKNKAEEGRFRDAEGQLLHFKEELENCYIKDEQYIQGLIKDVQRAIEDIKPEQYEIKGKHNLIGHTRAWLRQEAYFQSANFALEENDVQREMVSKQKSRKMKMTFSSKH